MTEALTHHRVLILEGIEVICSIGFHAVEQQEPQRVLIDLEIALAPQAEPLSDDVGDTLDYDTVRDAVISLAQERHYNLQETLARRLLDHVMAMRDVIGVTVTTSKPDAYSDCETVSYQIGAYPSGRSTP